MAPHVTTVFTAARLGSRVVRSLTRPVRHRLAPWPRDPWATPPRPALLPDLGRRTRALTWLVVQGVVGLFVVLPLLFFFGLLLALGWDPAGWLLGLTLFLALLGLLRAVIRGARLLSPQPLPDPAARSGVSSLATVADDETRLLTLLRSGERALPAAGRAALHATVIATRDALRATAEDAALGRDAFDAQQAAREDLPELLRTYRAAPHTPETERLLLGQLTLIERRMKEITRERQERQLRALEAQHRYLESKYGERGETPPRR
ncbi:hypothetical protein [Deinococcus sp. YIM 77859]|uniref:hypothetical protein n=1 Tax=Deinococcus sp. YIM 77859 TaxID=1540221 RepID=UPI000553C056|nr:hypothetical protein [Deinococcus sp. YIM 77859]